MDRPIHFQPWMTVTRTSVQLVEPSHGMSVPSRPLTAPSWLNSDWKM